MLRSSSLTPLRSKLGDLADFLQRKLLNGDLLRLRSLRLKVPDSEPLPPFGAFNTIHTTHAMLLATYTSHREPSLFGIMVKGERQAGILVKFVSTYNLLMQHAHASTTYVYIRQNVHFDERMGPPLIICIYRFKRFFK